MVLVTAGDLVVVKLSTNIGIMYLSNITNIVVITTIIANKYDSSCFSVYLELLLIITCPFFLVYYAIHILIAQSLVTF